MWNSQQDFIGIHLMINGDLNNNERVSLLFILMLCLSGERKQSGIGERKKGRTFSSEDTFSRPNREE